MKDVFEFDSGEVARILYDELIRRGKEVPSPCGIEVEIKSSGRRFDSVLVKIGPPIPGAKEY